MPERTLHRLSARKVATENKRGRYADGGSLYLQVSEQGTKSWLFRFTQDAKARQMGLGDVVPASTSLIASRWHDQNFLWKYKQLLQLIKIMKNLKLFLFTSTINKLLSYA